jgi:hypothetical protein
MKLVVWVQVSVVGLRTLNELHVVKNDEAKKTPDVTQWHKSVEEGVDTRAEIGSIP